MNERIAQLMAYASGGACYDGNQLALYGEDIEKFAELIVKECAKVVNDTEYPYENESDKNAWDICCVWSAAKLKEHFGVEE